MVGGTREPQTARGEEHDGNHATVLRVLGVAFDPYGIHYAVENPKAELGLRPVVLAHGTRAQRQVVLQEGKLLSIPTRFRQAHQR